MILEPVGDRMRRRQRAEGAAEGLELVVGQVLIAEEDYPPLVQGVPDLLRRRLIDGLREIQPRNLRADRGRDRLDDEPLRAVGSGGRG